MRHSVPRTLSAVSIVFASILSVSLSAQDQNSNQPTPLPAEIPRFRVMTHPREDRLRRGRSFRGDLRNLPQVSPHKIERPEFEAPAIIPVPFPGTQSGSSQSTETGGANVPSSSAPAPAPSNSFEGLD